MAVTLGSTGITFPDATTQTTAASGAFAAGTRMSFQQTAAPTGWTKDTTAAINDAILRLVTGSVSSGGSTAFSTFNAQTVVGSTTLSTSQIPSHQHSIGGNAAGTGASVTAVEGGAGSAQLSGSAGGGGSHNHSITTSIKYYDFIIASKN